MYVNIGTGTRYKSIAYAIIEQTSDNVFLLKSSTSDHDLRVNDMNIPNIVKIKKNNTRTDLEPIKTMFKNKQIEKNKKETMFDAISNIVYFPIPKKEKEYDVAIIINASLYIRVNDLEYSKRSQLIAAPIVDIMINDNFLINPKNQFNNIPMVPFLYKMLVLSTIHEKERKISEVRLLIKKEQFKKEKNKELTQVDLFYFQERMTEESKSFFFFNICVISRHICEKLKTLTFIELFSNDMTRKLIFTKNMSPAIIEQISYCKAYSEFKIIELNPNIRVQCKDLALASYVPLVAELSYTKQFRPENGKYDEQSPIPTKTMIIKFLYNCYSSEYLSKVICECTAEMNMINRIKYTDNALLVNIDLSLCGIDLETPNIQQYRNDIQEYWPSICVLDNNRDILFSIIDDRNHISNISEYRKKTMSLDEQFAPSTEKWPE